MTSHLIASYKQASIACRATESTGSERAKTVIRNESREKPPVAPLDWAAHLDVDPAQPGTASATLLDSANHIVFLPANPFTFHLASDPVIHIRDNSHLQDTDGGRYEKPSWPSPSPPLFRGCVERIIHAADSIGIRGIVAHALSEQAKAFYSALGFEPSALDPMTLMVTLGDVRAILAAPTG